jgi:hypothetical protein
MIKKVAETHALKKAFGISGLQCEHDWEFTGDKAYPIDTDEPPTIDTINYIEGLIRTSTFDDEQTASMEGDLLTLTNAKAEEMVQMLKDNQRSPKENETMSQGMIQQELDLIDKNPKA